MKQKQHHSLIEDIQAIFTASLFVALGIYFFNVCGFLTGGTAGIALLLTHMLPYNFGLIFFVINLPFYYLAWTRMGKRFTLNTFLSVSLVSFMTESLNYFIHVDSLNPAFAAIVGGFLIGMGILINFRHVSSLGGLGIMAKYVQDKLGFSAGKFQMAVDITIVCVGFLLVSPEVLAYSVVGAVALNLVIANNHKPGRYQIS